MTELYNTVDLYYTSGGTKQREKMIGMMTDIDTKLNEVLGLLKKPSMEGGRYFKRPSVTQKKKKGKKQISTRHIQPASMIV
jgi:hypothetical protein